MRLWLTVEFKKYVCYVLDEPEFRLLQPRRAGAVRCQSKTTANRVLYLWER